MCEKNALMCMQVKTINLNSLLVTREQKAAEGAPHEERRGRGRPRKRQLATSLQEPIAAERLDKRITPQLHHEHKNLKVQVSSNCDQDPCAPLCLMTFPALAKYGKRLYVDITSTSNEASIVPVGCGRVDPIA